VTRLTVAEAAEALGITKEAVRKRVSRETLRADKDPDGTVRVYVPASEMASPTGAAHAPHSREIVEVLREQVADLRAQLEEANVANRENRRIIAALTSRIPELPPAPSQEPPESSVPASEGPGGEEPEPRPWWRRMFGS
jgi:hypothetical protein